MGTERSAVWVALAFALAPAAAAANPGDAAREELRTSFDRTFRPPGVRRIELRVHRNGRLASRRTFDLALARFGGRSRALLRFREPEYLRGCGLLIVEAGGGRSDVWLYQPELRRARRVGNQQRADSFYGSDLTFEDLERPRWEHFAIRSRPGTGGPDGPAWVVDAEPPADSQYALLRVWIDRRWSLVERIDFWRSAADSPAKRLRVHVDGTPPLVRGMRVEPLGRAGHTEVEFTRVASDRALDPRVFSLAQLEREGEDLFELSERLGEEPRP